MNLADWLNNFQGLHFDWQRPPADNRHERALVLYGNTYTLHIYICGDDLRSNAPGQARPGLNQRLQMEATTTAKAAKERMHTSWRRSGLGRWRWSRRSSGQRIDGWMDGWTDVAGSGSVRLVN